MGIHFITLYIMCMCLCVCACYLFKMLNCSDLRYSNFPQVYIYFWRFILFILEREGERNTERGREKHKQTPCWALSPTQGSISGPEIRPELINPQSDTQPTLPLRHPFPQVLQILHPLNDDFYFFVLLADVSISKLYLPKILVLVNLHFAVL